jgi:hypothetical protein
MYMCICVYSIVFMCIRTCHAQGARVDPRRALVQPHAHGSAHLAVGGGQRPALCVGRYVGLVFI